KIDRDIVIPHLARALQNLAQPFSNSIDSRRVEELCKRPQALREPANRHSQIVNRVRIVHFLRSGLHQLVEPGPPSQRLPRRKPRHRDLRHRFTLTESDNPYTSRNTADASCACHCSMSTSRSECSRSAMPPSSCTFASTRPTRCS